jgi:heme exporter protein A
LPPLPETAALAGDNLACRRGERLVFEGLAFRLETGGALVLTGPNGSGKSSLLRLLAGLLTPAAGRLLWGGMPVEADPAAYRSAIHYVGHLDGVKPALSPREMLHFWAALRGVARPAIETALAAFGIASIADWPCRWLSAGQRRRLALARLIAAPAPLWLLDEPSAGLDADGEARLVEVIESHRRSGGRVALAMHQPLALADTTALAVERFAARPGDPFAT